MGIRFLDDAARRFTTDGSQLAVKVADACLAGIPCNDVLHDALRDFQLLRRETMLCQHFGQEVTRADIHFLLKHVAWKIDNIHPIDQWTRNLVFHIARADEEHL